MKKTESILLLISIVSVLLELFHVPGGAFMTTVSLSLLSILYMFFGFALLNGIGLRELFKKDSYKKLTALRIIGAIIGGLFLATAITGILFALHQWPGALVNLAAGIIGLAITLVVALIKYFSTTGTFYIGIILRCLLFGGVATVFYFIS